MKSGCPLVRRSAVSFSAHPSCPALRYQRHSQGSDSRRILEDDAGISRGRFDNPCRLVWRVLVWWVTQWKVILQVTPPDRVCVPGRAGRGAVENML